MDPIPRHTQVDILFFWQHFISQYYFSVSYVRLDQIPNILWKFQRSKFFSKEATIHCIESLREKLEKIHSLHIFPDRGW